MRQQTASTADSCWTSYSLAKQAQREWQHAASSGAPDEIRDTFYNDLAWVFNATGNYESALRAARQIHSEQRSERLNDIALAIASSHNWSRARSVALEIRDTFERDDAFGELANAAFEDANLDRCLALVAGMSDADYLLEEFASSLAEAGREQRSLQFMGQIRDDKMRIHVLLALAESGHVDAKRMKRAGQRGWPLPALCRSRSGPRRNG